MIMNAIFGTFDKLRNFVTERHNGIPMFHLFDKHWKEEDLGTFMLWKLPERNMVPCDVYRLTAVILDRTKESHWNTTFMQLVAEGTNEASIRLWATVNGIDIFNDEAKLWNDENLPCKYVLTL